MAETRREIFARDFHSLLVDCSIVAMFTLSEEAELKSENEAAIKLGIVSKVAHKFHVLSHFNQISHSRIIVLSLT